MGTAVLQVAGRRHEIACRDGEEPRLEALGRLIDAKAQAAAAGMGGSLNEARQLLFAALLLADELGDARAGIPPPAPAQAPAADPELVPLLDALADHLEALAGRLEKAPAEA